MKAVDDLIAAVQFACAAAVDTASRDADRGWAPGEVTRYAGNLIRSIAWSEVPAVQDAAAAFARSRVVEAREAVTPPVAQGVADNDALDALRECVVAIRAYRAWNDSATLEEIAALIPPGRFKLVDTRRTDTQFCEFVTKMIDDALAKARAALGEE